VDGGKKAGKDNRSESLIEGICQRPRDRRSHLISGSEIARKLIFRGKATIETTISEKGYVAVGGRLRGEKWLIPNHCWTRPRSFTYARM
jgi:hypothetical protein